MRLKTAAGASSAGQADGQLPVLRPGGRFKATTATGFALFD